MTTYTLTATDPAAQAAQWTYRTTLDPVLSAPRSRVIAVAMLRHAREHGYEALFMDEWRAKRADWTRRNVLVQRDWQTKVSRRPQRGRHHDSWTIREKYVRCLP